LLVVVGPQIAIGNWRFVRMDLTRLWSRVKREKGRQKYIMALAMCLPHVPIGQPRDDGDAVWEAAKNAAPRRPGPGSDADA